MELCKAGMEVVGFHAFQPEKHHGIATWFLLGFCCSFHAIHQLCQVGLIQSISEFDYRLLIGFGMKQYAILLWFILWVTNISIWKCTFVFMAVWINATNMTSIVTTLLLSSFILSGRMIMVECPSKSNIVIQSFVVRDSLKLKISVKSSSLYISCCSVEGGCVNMYKYGFSIIEWIWVEMPVNWKYSSLVIKTASSYSVASIINIYPWLEWVDPSCQNIRLRMCSNVFNCWSGSSEDLVRSTEQYLWMWVRNCTISSCFCASSSSSLWSLIYLNGDCSISFLMSKILIFWPLIIWI